MAKSGKVCQNLNLARMLAARALSELKKATPDNIAHLQKELKKARVEVRRLEREKTS